MASDTCYEELEKLAALHERGVLNEQEFNDHKARLLNRPERGEKRAGLVQRILVAIMWMVVFWFGSLFLAGAIAGGMNPENAAEAGREAGRILSGPLFFVALIAAIAGTVTRKLPLTR